MSKAFRGDGCLNNGCPSLISSIAEAGLGRVIDVVHLSIGFLEMHTHRLVKSDGNAIKRRLFTDATSCIFAPDWRHIL